ncbi:MAG: glycosyltransferase [Bacteroidetes bacterium]|nr:glycosyltransferase [Bacteroidota bacterium]
MPGLFVARHAEAAALFNTVGVVYVHPDNNIQTPEITDNLENGLRVIRVYYPVVKCKTPLLSLFRKGKAFQKNSSQAINYYIGKYGKPQLIHANILTRAGYIAMKHAERLRIPYIITEHWSRYLPVRIEYNGWIRKMITKKVVRQAAALLPVTENLSAAMKSYHLENQVTEVIANVVDDMFFQSYRPAFQDDRLFRIVHVSCFDEKAKNVKGIFRAMKELQLSGKNFFLELIGEGPDFEEVKQYAANCGLSDQHYAFRGMLTGDSLTRAIAGSHCLLLFSNFENMPVVIAEAFACGIPVISSRVGGIHEVVNQENGILVPAGDEIALKDAVIRMMENIGEYNKEKIHAFAKENFSMQTIGSKLTEIYHQAITRFKK